jgi:Fe2+ transport system protein FeoA
VIQPAAAAVPSSPSPSPQSLRDLAPHRPAAVIAVLGDDALTQRLLACGLWPGASVERIGAAPFGDPLLFRVQGYRLALRRDEALRVQVQPVNGGES